MKKHLLFLFLLVAMSSHAQLRTGLLVGGGLGFDRNVAPNMKNPDIIEKVAKGTKLFEDYKFNLQLGYRFRIEDKKHTRWFYDIDPLVNAKVFRSKDVRSDEGRVEANDVNLSLALSSSVNYKIVKGLYAGLGLEPTWYVASDGKKFDIPLLWKVGYNINNKIDISVNYRLGFTNTIDTEKFRRGQISDCNISVFIPFTLCK